jgi:hypothetical protein
MKRIIVFLLFTCCIYSFAQAQLPQDETGRIVFAEVVKADSLDQKLLYSNAKTFLTASGYHLTSTAEDSLAGKLTASHGFYVYAKGYLTKKIHGKIIYTAIVEVKNGRYRYIFNDFVFHYYAEDRTFKFNPTGRVKPLEELKASGWQALWESHKQSTTTHIAAQVKSLKLAMSKIPQIKIEPVITKQATKAEW